MKRNKIISLILMIFMWSNSYAWWEAGHMLVADIAYANLTLKAKKEVKILLPLMDLESTSRNSYKYNSINPNYTLMSVALWPDNLHAFPNYLSVSKTWHYIEDAYSNDGTTTPSAIPRDNVVWAINQFRQHLSLTKANKSSRARALSYLVHFVGDIHQPLHTAEYYSKELHSGDRGGNLYQIYYKEDNGDVIKNLHSLWDSALLLFPSKNYPHNVNSVKDVHSIMKLITKDYPKSYFANKIKILDPSLWQQESHQLAINAHEIPLGSAPDSSYLNQNTQLAEQQIVLAGYRLAQLLNQIL